MRERYFASAAAKAIWSRFLWHEGVGTSLYLKRLEAGKFIWPVSRTGDAVQVSAAQLGYLLEGVWGYPLW
ncbi:IS66 family insertion sequence element accessory protein TnpB [Roseovarius sp. M141]|uniref:IS66 family insertion sequence element accessory protein TnpB n=1 Tax=Roseovarius sp. M141 TaxID=2583806 RepID=UPI0034E93946